ncbi:hypothetical protein Vi05172_g665 [Venturia inaequalis]|nr:hypothetical protein Vi05172_g665 [Venturia inaequalis]
MHLASTSSAAILFLFITPSLGSFSCCGIRKGDIITRHTQVTKSCCVGTYQKDVDACLLTGAAQLNPLISCCTAGGRRGGVKLCNGVCTTGDLCTLF